jgi:hypothetical protein
VNLIIDVHAIAIEFWHRAFPVRVFRGARA